MLKDSLRGQIFLYPRKFCRFGLDGHAENVCWSVLVYLVTLIRPIKSNVFLLLALPSYPAHFENGLTPNNRGMSDNNIILSDVFLMLRESMTLLAGPIKTLKLSLDVCRFMALYYQHIYEV